MARTKYNILTSRVSPKDSSKKSAIDDSEVLRTSDHQVAELLRNNPYCWDTFLNTEGYHPGTWAITFAGYMIHSGLNAARNLGMKFYQRYSSQKLRFVRTKLAHQLHAFVLSLCVEGQQSPTRA